MHFVAVVTHFDIFKGTELAVQYTVLRQRPRKDPGTLKTHQDNQANTQERTLAVVLGTVSTLVSWYRG